MDTQALIDHIVQRLRRVEGVVGIVLGGSRARGTHTPDSDIDLGLYYDPAFPPHLPVYHPQSAVAHPGCLRRVNHR